MRNIFRGFTLVELLVVISIISFLSMVVLASLNTARVKGRDTKRVADLHQIKLALELYFSDHGYYPGIDDTILASNDSYYWPQLTEMLKPYMPTLPKDPVNNRKYFYYYYSPGGNGGSTGATVQGAYDLVSWFENPSNILRCELHDYINHEGVPFNQEPYYWCRGNTINFWGGDNKYLYSANE